MKSNKIMLVYQAGIANVFRVDCFNVNPNGRKEERLLQGAFATCQDFAHGCAAMGAVVRTCHCNMAGDIARQQWNLDLDNAPFNPTEVSLN